MSLYAHNSHTTTNTPTVLPHSCYLVSLRGRTAFAAGTALLLSFLLLGCVSKRKAEAQARAAFIAGQKQAMEIAQRAQAMGPTITVVGEVRNPTLPWTSDMTLAKALIAAEYYGRKDPSQILIARNGQAIAYDPKKLLNGDDVPLQPRDVIEIRQ